MMSVQATVGYGYGGAPHFEPVTPAGVLSIFGAKKAAPRLLDVLFLTTVKPHDLRMCDSPSMQIEFSQDDLNCYNLEHITQNAQCSIASLESESLNKKNRNLGSWLKRNKSFSDKFQLEQEIKRLQKQLQEEIELHITLENAIQKKDVTIASHSCLPSQAKELLSNISVLETTISDLEQQMVSLHFQISQERNERKLAEYHSRHPFSDSISNLSLEVPKTPDAVCPVVISNEEKTPVRLDIPCRPVEFRDISNRIQQMNLWDHPNQLSEEMVNCMKNIFISLADSAFPSKSPTLGSQSSSVSPQGHLSNSSWWSSSERSIVSAWLQSPQINLLDNSEVLDVGSACDPYRVHGKLSWADIGNYGLAIEVSWMSVGKKQLDYASGALKRFRNLVEQLAKVNPIHLNNDERLAFWINIYNALIMHAYLAYGVPRSDLKLFSLMQKAAYTIGGHSFSAVAIEYGILKMKPPVHRPQIALLLALHKLRMSEEQKKNAIESSEPLVAFALSCGMYSSPGVKIYTAKNVREELEAAQHDFIRACVGVSSKGRLLVPKMVHSFAKGLVSDANLAVWISRYLPENQAAFVQQCISQRRQSLLSSQNCSILPFDSRFRYLFLPATE